MEFIVSDRDSQLCTTQQVISIILERSERCTIQAIATELEKKEYKTGVPVTRCGYPADLNIGNISNNNTQLIYKVPTLCQESAVFYLMVITIVYHNNCKLRIIPHSHYKNIYQNQQGN